MKFVEQFKNIMSHPLVRNEAARMLDYGKNDPLFMNYFGVNFDDQNVVSVKLYFSFFKKPTYECLKNLSFTQQQYDLIDTYWVPPNKYEFMHQGLTIGLKCYLKNDGCSINHYFHFRSPQLTQHEPKLIHCSAEDNENTPGICIENHGKKQELKHYYYLSSDSAKNEIVSKLGMPMAEAKKINLIEYTESDIESKVNLIYDQSKDIQDYFIHLKNPLIQELNAYIFETYQLYFYGPGVRFNSATRAIYYVSKPTYYGLHQEQTIAELLK